MEDRSERKTPDQPDSEQSAASKPEKKKAEATPNEIGGPEGPEPTRYGDWERNGRVSDF